MWIIKSTLDMSPDFSFLLYSIVLRSKHNNNSRLMLSKFLSGETRFPLKNLNLWIQTTVNNYFIPESVFVFLYQDLKLYHTLFFRTCYEQLREDFQFNLAILDERDRELAHYDNLTTKALVVILGSTVQSVYIGNFFLLHFVNTILHKHLIAEKYSGPLFKHKV